MLSRTLLVCSLVICAVAQEEAESRLVYTSQGPVRGYKGSGDIFVFYNIPYATTPTGVHKFKAPLPPPKWTETLEAVNRNIICPQIGMEMNVSQMNQTMQEDCLVANIYVPDTEARHLPVVVYVHGGAYQSGYGDSMKPINLIKNENMIVVTFNYRLGIHGFLCLGTQDAPGNAGMKDQVALLRWVHKNIGKFGGNPHDVTLTGCSAGSHAVDLLMLSKTTNGLISKVILNSGVSINPSSVQINPLETAKDHAISLNFTNVEDIFALGEFYKTTPLESLMSDAYMDKKDSNMIFVPCVERFVGVEMFLEEAPIHTLKRGNYKRLPMIYGFTDMEGLIRYPNFEDWKDDMNEHFADYLPVDLKFSSEEEKESVAQIVKEFYFGNQSVNDDTLSSFVDYFTDVTFAYGTLKAVKLHVENGRHAYLYEYSFVDDDDQSLPNGICGAGHCAQEAALLDGSGMSNLEEENISDEYKNVKQIIRELWSNFIKTGNPVPSNSSLPIWIPAGVNGSPHLSLGKTVEIKGPLLEERFHFWDDIYTRHYSIPRPPIALVPKTSRPMN